MLGRQLPRVKSAALTDYSSVHVDFSGIPRAAIKFPLSFLYASWTGHRDSMTSQRELPSINLFPPPRLASSPRFDVSSGDLILEWDSGKVPLITHFDVNFLLKHGSCGLNHPTFSKLPAKGTAISSPPPPLKIEKCTNTFSNRVHSIDSTDYGR